MKKRDNLFCISALAGIFVVLSVDAQAITRRVPSDFPTIQAAINAAANGDTVLVAPGTYTENINFVGRAILITSESGPQLTIIDGNHIGSVVTINSGEGPASELSAFTIRNGAPGFGFGRGAGILIQSSSPTIAGNNIINNVGNDGGGINVGDGSPIISNNRITNNNGGSGGGISAGGGSPIIRENVIANNFAQFGGGLSMIVTSAQILNNTISSNLAQFGGGIELFASGPITLRGNVISLNSAQQGGGIWMVNFSPALIVQNLIISNRATSDGGGVFWLNPPDALVNNTIANNDSPNGSGVSAGFSLGTLFINNIVVAKAGQIAFSGVSPNSIPTVFKSNNVFSPKGVAYAGCPDQTGTNGNISLDPLFVDVLSNNYHLRLGSPSIDVGDNLAANLPATDFDGDIRIFDGNGDGVAVVDMGIDEALPLSALFDICLQDDSSRDTLRFNSVTGVYQFNRCAGGLVLGGTGSLTRRGSTITLQQFSNDRRLVARFDGSVNKGTASIQVFAQGTTFTIMDTNTTNNLCSCASP